MLLCAVGGIALPGRSLSSGTAGQQQVLLTPPASGTGEWDPHPGATGARPPAAEGLAGSEVRTPLQEMGNSPCRSRGRYGVKVQKQEVGGWDFLFLSGVKGWLK